MIAVDITVVFFVNTKHHTSIDGTILSKILQNVRIFPKIF